MSQEGRILKDVDYADVHGQFKFNFKHAAISGEDSKRFLDWAFWRDFQLNGPSLYRISRTLLAGFKRYKDSPDARVRERFTREMGKLSGVYSSALWAMERQFRKVDSNVSEQIHALRHEFKRESGFLSRMLPGIARPRAAVDDAARRKTAGRGKDLRAAHDSGAHQLGGSVATLSCAPTACSESRAGLGECAGSQVLNETGTGWRSASCQSCFRCAIAGVRRRW
jgi:hypothetical protein